MKRLILCLSLAVQLFAVARHSLGQAATGTPPFGSYGGGPFDVINLGNLNVHFNVPIFSKAGRGFPLSYALSYDSSIWHAVQSGSTQTWTPVNNSLWGWRGIGEALGGYISYSTHQGSCADHTPATYYNSFAYHDTFGTVHSFPIQLNTCVDGTDELVMTATDGSGLTLDAHSLPVSATTLYTASGLTLKPPLQDPNGSGRMTDRNGNFVSWTTSAGTTTFSDAFGTTALTVSGTGSVSSPHTYTYTSPAGTQVSVTVNYVQYTVATNFGMTGITEYGKQSIALVDSVTLPDNTQYKFAYEATPSTPTAGACTPISGTYSTNCVTARIANITLPTGGQIAYTYTGGTGGSNGVLANDGSTSGFTRTLTPGGAGTYVRAIAAAGLPFTTTTVTDAASNQTTMLFDGIYETQRSIAGLMTINTCYNGALIVNCNQGVPSFPITKRTVVTSLGSAVSSQVTSYNSSGLPTETDTYNYGAFTTGTSIGTTGALAQKVLTTYMSFAPNNLGNTIANKPASVVVQDGSGNLKAKTTFTYDENPLQTSSATNLTAITGPRGNLTTVTNYVTSTSTLVRHLEYYDDGNLYQSQDVNSSTWDTTYTYGACGNSLLTNVAFRLGLSRSFTWNCTGGVQTTATDENSQIVSTSYTDPNFWRPASVQDQLLNTTNFTYISPTQIESRMNFNGVISTQDIVTTLDGMGRSVYSQQKQSPNSTNYDSVQYTYDPTTLTNKATVPYAGTLQQSAPNGTATGASTYDAAGRVSQSVDGGGGTVAYTYSNNDVLSTLTPVPGNETAPKKKQLEYDALGRLISVCEITTASGNGNCGQSVPQTGYWTKYAYGISPNVNSLTVTQNAQSGTTQTRTYIYDMLGRLTSETNPESGTVTYIYDTESSACGSITRLGDLVLKTDANGNITCYYHDALHRLVHESTVAGSGPNPTPDRFFVYDSATVNGIAMVNAKGRLAEAYTCNTCTGAHLTDEGFSYSARGEVTDVYESTPHSGGWYHVNATYWANGALNVLNGGTSPLPGLPKMTYAPEGEGRISSVSASTGQNPVTSTVYDLANHKTTVNFGSLDSDVFTYDPNTGRLNQYKYNVGTQSVTGNLTWNANGSLGTLAISDQLNTTNSQTCNYSHDDLSRIASANCASVWSQTFGFDPFGNISKSGSSNFLPTYNTATNRFSTVPGGTPTYDANGNLTNDLSHTYSWDADGNALTIDTVNLTYDALGRMVEQARGSTFTQIVYSPVGSKLALMSAQTLQKAFVALPTGATAVYTASGLAYYRHADWLGSSRLATTPSRTKYYDVAYGPYGESYSGSGTTDLNFTGQNQDTVSGLYDFLYREYHPVQGRWISPDPAGLAAVNPGNPQTWNRYAYVGNGPLTTIDPLGLENLPGCTAATQDCFGDGGGFGYGGDQNTPGGSMTDPLQSGNPLADPNYWNWYYNECQTNPDCGPTFWDPIHYFFGEVDIYKGREGTVVYAAGNGPDSYMPWYARNGVLAILDSKNDCAKWFNTGTGSAHDIMSNVPINLGNPSTGPLGGPVADTPQGPAGPITVYPDGGFYNNGGLVGAKCNYVTGDCTGGYRAGSYGARMIILLHELAHKVYLIPCDNCINSATNQSDINTQTVMKHCATTVGPQQP